MSSSARRRNDCGTVSPSAFAVLRLMTSSTCCARAESGQTAAPPRSVMNSRRFMQSLRNLILGRKCHAPDDLRDNTTPLNRGLWATSRLEDSRNLALPTPASRHSQEQPFYAGGQPRRADVRGSWEQSEIFDYSITSSARNSSDCGIVSPSAFAVLLLMTNSNRVACRSGNSPGRAPSRIFATCSAAIV